MSIFAISDLHLSMAPGTEKPMDIFGSRWNNHAQRIKENWLKCITDEDTVVIPGDISWGLKLEEAAYDLDWLDSLPGDKIIIKGNHDLWWSGISRLNSMYGSITFLQNTALCIENAGTDGRSICICGSRGWITPDDEDYTEADDKIYKRELLRMRASLVSAEEKNADEIIAFMHFPPASSPQCYSGFMQLFEEFGIKRVYYGHIHGEEGFRKTMQGVFYGTEYRLISADYLNCCPIRITDQDCG